MEATNQSWVLEGVDSWRAEEQTDSRGHTGGEELREPGGKLVGRQDKASGTA